MNIILSIISAFVLIVGALTFHTSSEEAHATHNYESLTMSTAMILVGAFCLCFFMLDLVVALIVVLVMAAIMFIAHSIVGYQTSVPDWVRNKKDSSAPGNTEDAYALNQEFEDKIARAKHAANQFESDAVDQG